MVTAIKACDGQSTWEGGSPLCVTYVCEKTFQGAVNVDMEQQLQQPPTYKAAHHNMRDRGLKDRFTGWQGSQN